MAKIEGTQNIPAEWLDEYRATLTEKLPTGAARKRYPFRLRLKQLGGYKVTKNQKTQRQRWLQIRDKFKNISAADKQRWYQSRPPWHSLLWYFNYFMMSGLMGNAVVGDKGGGVIKGINHYTFMVSAGTAADVTVNIDTCDPSKAVVFFYGGGAHELGAGIVIALYPYPKSLNSSQVIIRPSMDSMENWYGSLSVIEYI